VTVVPIFSWGKGLLMLFTLRWAALIAAIMICAAGAVRADDGKIKVTVVAILGSEKHTHICNELKDIAPELQKKNPKLTGFTLERSTCKSMKIGEKDSFHLVDKEFAEVKLKVKDDTTNRVSLTIKPPTWSEMDYTTCCGKFFPVYTGYMTKEKDELLIIAIMVKPCTKK
jgi:hypothetical protein